MIFARRLIFAVVLSGLSWTGTPAIAQNMDVLVKPTPSEMRASAVVQRSALRAQSLASNLAFESVGPTVMSGRVTDVDARPDDPTHFYVAYASGGLWRTTNNGQSFEPVFDHESVMTIGDIAVDWSPGGAVWVGTGENNSSRSSYAGDGVYRSVDGGVTWESKGLAATQHVSRIVLHPENPNIIWVAALGRLYSHNPERGVYRSDDGGATWTKTLYVDEKTGASDLIIDPTNPDVLYAAMWQRDRRAWNFVESGRGSGIYKSTDGGRQWTKLSTGDSGFPTGDGVGRIGLDLFRGNTSTLYALLDNYNRRPPEDDEAEDGLTRSQLRSMDRAEFLALEDEVIETFLRDEDFPAKHTALSVRVQIEDGTLAISALVEYLEDANSLLFETSVIGAEVYRSDDGGASWSKVHENYLDTVYNSYGYYFGQIRVAPDTADRIYILGVPLLRSDDGGANWRSIGGPNLHADHQALWANPNRIGHLINGNDGGLNISYDDGDTWSKANSPSVGQFYAVQVDDAEPYNVYGGLQDNGVWVGPSTYEASIRWHGSGRYPYTRLAGGDGMQVEVDTRDNNIVYTGSQFGFYSRINKETGDRMSIRPRHELGDRPLRFNWQSPIHLSRHHQDILYFGANRLYRSLNRGENMQPISEDLTGGGRPGDVPFGTLASIDESPLRFGLIYTGSDDGLVHVSRDGGAQWTRISDRLPKDLWVSRVEASAHAEGRVYVSLNGYRSDHFAPYVFRSDDYGATWTRIDKGIPMEPVNVITEDPHNEDLLFVGTDHGVYVSLDRGSTWMALFEGLPSAPVHDIKVQARERDLVVGTHGRSIYIADISQLEALTETMRAKELHLFDLESVAHSDRWGSRYAFYAEATEPEATISWFASEPSEATVRILKGSVEVKRFIDATEAGLNYVTYDLSVDSVDLADSLDAEPADNGTTYLPPGTYTVEVSVGDASATGTLEVTERRGGRGRGGAAAPGIK